MRFLLVFDWAWLHGAAGISCIYLMGILLRNHEILLPDQHLRSLLAWSICARRLASRYVNQWGQWKANIWGWTQNMVLKDSLHLLTCLISCLVKTIYLRITEKFATIPLSRHTECSKSCNLLVVSLKAWPLVAFNRTNSSSTCNVWYPINASNETMGSSLEGQRALEPRFLISHRFKSLGKK